jgi:hypothetical protein
MIMGLDVRLPIGLMFVIVGLLVLLLGLFGDAAMYERSLGYNVNLWWGIASLAFGLLFVFLSRKSLGRLRQQREEET